MTSSTQDRILVALDGSDRSMKTVEYLGAFKPFSNKEIVLFNVFSSVPDCYWDVNNEAFSRNAMAQARGWEHQRRSQMDEYMERARSFLVQAGYPGHRVHVKVRDRKKGVARDIIKEAGRGYDAVLARRRGFGALLHVVMGSTTTKLVERLSSVPVMLAGLEAVNHSLFLAVDGSEGAARAVDYTAGIVQGTDCRVVLCSVLRDYDLPWREEGADHVKTFVDGMQSAVDQAADRLKAAGIPSKRIQRRVITGTKSRAGTIADAAKQDGCDTIVLGRRGRSNVRDFNIGRVPMKVIHAARKMSVWIIP